MSKPERIKRTVYFFRATQRERGNVRAPAVGVPTASMVNSLHDAKSELEKPTVNDLLQRKIAIEDADGSVTYLYRVEQMKDAQDGYPFGASFLKLKLRPGLLYNPTEDLVKRWAKGDNEHFVGLTHAVFFETGLVGVEHRTEGVRGGGIWRYLRAAAGQDDVTYRFRSLILKGTVDRFRKGKLRSARIKLSGPTQAVRPAFAFGAGLVGAFGGGLNEMVLELKFKKQKQSMARRTLKSLTELADDVDLESVTLEGTDSCKGDIKLNLKGARLSGEIKLTPAPLDPDGAFSMDVFKAIVELRQKRQEDIKAAFEV